ncbi:hypothetical protein O6H91_11G075000 [Diphasiastrum complanatum]|uniref:Uncharacterized protein n=1 Tax=Diphasiastrum complanatum TaxID=34168 RepID=A0ACC2CAJ4_DIPCM|nr:hypothetical protein O6H91_11G075000 [Diphasiastrum complanatum]
MFQEVLIVDLLLLCIRATPGFSVTVKENSDNKFLRSSNYSSL